MTSAREKFHAMTTDRQPFNCWQCGACCHFIWLSEEGKHLDRGDGVCKHLLPDNTCEIYEDRPDICNTTTMFERHWRNSMTWEEYLALSERVCRVMDEKINGAGE